jgi:hypothetical protein
MVPDATSPILDMMSGIDMHGQSLMHHAAKSNAHNIAILLKHINREKLLQVPE